MSEEVHYMDEIAPFDEEQWNRLIDYYRRTAQPKIAQGLQAAMEFRGGMKTIQQMAARTSENEIAALQQSILELALGVEPEQGE